MPLLITPRQLEQRAELYHQIGSMIAAGLRLQQALESLVKHPPARYFRKPLRRVLHRIDEGESFTDSMTGVSPWMTAFDLALLEAGEKSGRLDQCLRILSNYYQEQARLMKEVIRNLAYPLMVLHTALLLFPLPLFTDLVLKGAVAPFLLNKLLIFGPLYSTVFLLLYATQSAHGERWRSLMERVFRFIPLLGSSLRKIALARLAASLDALLAAGIRVFDAWEMAATASGSPHFRRTVFAWRDDLENGVTPAEAMSESRAFPEFFVNVYHSAEISGRQEEALQRLHEKYYEDGVRELRMFCKVAPAIIYMSVLGYAAYQIIHFYAQHFESFDKI